jgi:hypothetical protein
MGNRKKAANQLPFVNGATAEVVISRVAVAVLHTAKDGGNGETGSGSDDGQFRG